MSEGAAEHRRSGLARTTIPVCASAKMPPCNVPPLVSRDKLRKLMLIGAILGGALLLLGSFAVVTLVNR